jgi:histidine ammonia-lyase
VYGVTTGFGADSHRRVAPDRAAELQRDLITYHLNGTGPATPDEVVRATLLIRANCLARGHSGVRPEVIERLLEHLRRDLLPVVPQRGSVGASGDLIPLSYVAAALIGAGEHGLPPLELEPKEGLALINGTSFTAGYAAIVLPRLARLAAFAEVCTALAVQALGGDPDHYAAFLHEHKPHPGQVASAAHLRHLLRGASYERDARPPAGRPVQDPYSLRCTPHVVGVLRDTLEWADRWVETEINSANDNPLFEVTTGLAHAGGNFYAGHLAQAMDSVKLAAANVADLLDRQLQLLVDPRYSNGLPGNLVPPAGPDDRLVGHGFKAMQIACSAITAEALTAAAPASVHSRSTEAHNQDKVSMGPIAARDAYRVVTLLEEVTAIHLLAACQAADLRGPELLSPATRPAYEAVRRRVTPLTRDRRLDHDIRAVLALVRTTEPTVATGG